MKDTHIGDPVSHMRFSSLRVRCQNSDGQFIAHRFPSHDAKQCRIIKGEAYKPLVWPLVAVAHVFKVYICLGHDQKVNRHMMRHDKG